MRLGGSLHVRGKGDAKVPERNVIGGQIRRRTRAGAQERQRVSLLQQIPQAGHAAQGKRSCVEFGGERSANCDSRFDSTSNLSLQKLSPCKRR